VAAAVAAAVLVVVFKVVDARRGDRELVASLTAGACTFDRRSDPGNTGQHANQVSFEVDPPSGGVHLPSAASPAVYTATNRPPDGAVVHAMEHGDVVLWHGPDVPKADVDRLVAIFDKDNSDVLVVPRDTLGAGVAATAWQRRLLCPSLEEPAVMRFVRAFKDQGPEKVPE